MSETSPAPFAVSLQGARAVADGARAGGSLLLAGGRIVDSLPPGAHAHTIDLAGHLVFPALVNAHDHLQLNALPRPGGIGVRTNSYAWIEAFQPLFDDPALKTALAVPEAVRAWHGGLKNLLSGALLVAHHDPWQADFEDPSFPVEVLRRSGWSHSLGLADRYGPPVAASYAKTPPDVPWFIHLAEGTDDVAAAELSALEALGAFGPNTVLVHGLGLRREDIARVVARGAGVVWCPSSNLFMFGETLDPRPLASDGALALGTDSRFTGAFDLLTELRVASANTDLAPRELVRLVTTSAARLLRDPGAGGLGPGQRADLFVLGDPGGDPHAALVSASRADLQAIVRGGVPVVADPAFSGWFEAAGVETVPIRLDGRPKLCAERYLFREAARLEPGLELA